MAEVANNADKGIQLFYVDGTTIWRPMLIKGRGRQKRSRFCLKHTKSMETNGHKFRNSSKAGKKLVI